jgi:amino acid transporter
MKAWLKRPEITVGAVVGAIVTLAIAGSIDRFLPPDQRGGWGKAVRDALGPRWGEFIVAQIALGAVVFVVLVIAGAVIGVLFARFFLWFFQPPDAD